jgi:Zn-dependent M28 family amino/carboxypeptidase
MIVRKAVLLGALGMIIMGCTSAKTTHPDANIDVENLRATVQYLAGMQPPRNYKNIASLDKAAGYIRRKLESYGLPTSEQAFQVTGRTYKNIIATIGPTNKPRIIVGAHYDVCGDQPGADDNASGIAGLLETARFAKAHEASLAYRVEFVAYALEEPPFFGTRNMGSYVHAKSLHDAKADVHGMICLEMIGFFRTEENTQEYPLGSMKLFYPNTGNFIAVVGNFSSSGLVKLVSKQMRTAAIQVSTIKAPSWVQGVDFSDHRNYWKFGYDAVMVTDTAFYRNANYHETTDTANTLDFGRMQEVITGVCRVLVIQ